MPQTPSDVPAPAPLSMQKWWQSLPARIGAVTALLVAVAGLLNAITGLGVGTVLRGVQTGPEIEEVIDRQFITISTASVWPSLDVTRPPVAKLEADFVVLVRGRTKQGKMYLIEQPAGGVGYVAPGSLRELKEWQEQKRSAEQARDQERPLASTAGEDPQNWFPKGTRLAASWTEEATIRETPSTASRVVGALAAGRRLPFMTAQAGEVEVIAKLHGGEWYQVGQGGRSLGYVLGREATEIWPRRVRPPSPAGPVVNAWTVQSKKVTLVDAKTHYDLYFEEICSAPVCDSVTVYTGTPSKQESADTRYFTSERIVGGWKQDQRFEVYLQVPRLLTSVPGLTLYSCVGGVGACKPTQIFPSS